MEASPILNLATAPQAPPPSAGPSMSAKSADAGNVTLFAQVVREILVRTTTQSDTQPAHTLQPSSSAKSGKQGTLSPISLESVPMPSSQPASTQAILAVFPANQAAVALPVAPPPEQQAATNATDSKSQETAAVSLLDPIPVSQSVSRQFILPPTLLDPTTANATNQVPLPVDSCTKDSNNQQSSVASSQPNPLGAQSGPTPQSDKHLVAENQLPAFDLPAVSAPLTERNTAPVNQPPTCGIPDARPAVEGNTLNSPFQVSAPNLPDAPQSCDTSASAADQFSLSAYPVPAGAIDNKNSAAAQQPANSINQTAEPSFERRTVADVQILVDSPASPNAVIISFLPPQSAGWQAGATQNSSADEGASSIATHAALRQQAATKSAFSSAQLAAVLPTAFAPQLSNAKSAPTAQAALPTVVPLANAPSSNRSSSQEGSSNTAGQKSSDSSAAPSATASRDTSVFTQALASANDAKPQPVPTTGNQPSITAPAIFPLNDRPAAPAATSAPATPANPPETASHMLDGVPNPTVSNAQISQNSNHSEMRIAMQTDKLGTVELHARVSGDQIGAAITVERRDAHAALAVELPALQQALSDKQFRVDQITLLHSPLHSTTGDTGAQSQAQQGDRGTHRAQVPQPFLRDNSSAFMSFQVAAENRGIFDSQGRLSVQA